VFCSKSSIDGGQLRQVLHTVARTQAIRLSPWPTTGQSGVAGTAQRGRESLESTVSVSRL